MRTQGGALVRMGTQALAPAVYCTGRRPDAAGEGPGPVRAAPLPIARVVVVVGFPEPTPHQIPPETRAQHEGRSPEQWKNGQIPPETRLAQGQVAGAASKNERLKRFAAIARIGEERKGKVAGNRNRKRHTYAQQVTLRKPRPRAAGPGGPASNASQA